MAAMKRVVSARLKKLSSANQDFFRPGGIEQPRSECVLAGRAGGLGDQLVEAVRTE
jgi:hypothetical protein